MAQVINSSLFDDTFDGLDESEHALLVAYGAGFDKAALDAMQADLDDDLGADDEYWPDLVFGE